MIADKDWSEVRRVERAGSDRSEQGEQEITYQRTANKWSTVLTASVCVWLQGSRLRSFFESVRVKIWRGRTCVSAWSALEVFTEDPRPEDPGPDPGPVRVRVYILNGQLGPGRVPIYYFVSRVFLTLCVIPESIGEHRTREWSVSVSMRVCNLQFVKLGWEKCEREIRWKKKKKKTRVTSAARNRARAELMLVVLQADGDHGFLHEWCGKKAETKLKRRTCYWTRTQ